MTTSVRFLVIALSAGTMARMITLDPPRSTTGQPACVTAKNWVRAHPEALSSSYDVYSDYPIAWQKAIYAALGTPQRVALWQAHLDRVIATVHLTPTQRSFLTEAKRDVPKVLAGDAVILHQQEARAEQILGKDLTHTAFDDLGGLAKPATAFLDKCTCSLTGSGPGCGHPPARCTSTNCDQTVCGNYNMYTCDGSCVDVQ